MEEPIIYPDAVIEGVKESLRQADEGQLTPYIGIRNMLNRSGDNIKNKINNEPKPF